jgi:hypothetical protein
VLRENRPQALNEYTTIDTSSTYNLQTRNSPSVYCKESLADGVLSPHFGPDPVRSLPILVPGTDLGKHFGPTVDPLRSRWTDLGAHIGTYI